MPNASILVVDDNSDNRRLMEHMLRRGGHTVRLAASPQDALTNYDESITVAILDLTMPGMDGIELFRRLRALNPALQAIMVTAYGSIERAVEAMKAGAMDFLSKPVSAAVLLALVDKALNINALVAENQRLREAVKSKYDFSNLMGRSPAMQRLLPLAEEAARCDLITLITGESGAGKEVLARSIHYNSERRNQPFFALNCAAIPEQLVESELFGYEKGAFSGAQTRKAGLVEQAAEGTLLFDEIGDLPLPAQAKLLRLIESKEMIPLGATQPVKVRARLMAATNADLRERVRDRQFREDLFFRLNVFPIQVPPLRERREDILLLAAHILVRLARESGRDLPGFAPDANEFMLNARWDGNVRELANAIERAVIISRGQLIKAADFPMESTAPQSLGTQTAGLDLSSTERSLLSQALDRSGNNLSRAARLLGIGRGALRYRLEKYGIEFK